VATPGFQFLDQADRAVASIVEAPERWRIIEEGVRGYLMMRFPYAIYYRDYPDRLHILAFKHHSRRPDYWRYRISE
jgi:toxin ParE1/3/4